MPESFEQIIREVDAECRRWSIPMIGPQKAARLCELLREHKPQLVVEVGTGIGYSGLWIARTLRELGQGRLATFEKNMGRHDQAKSYFRRAGVENLITLYFGDAREVLCNVIDPIDFLFLDGGFENYYPSLMACRERLRDGALLVADNVAIGANDMTDYLDYVRTRFETRSEWFETDLSWNPRDAMEISVYKAQP